MANAIQAPTKVRTESFMEDSNGVTKIYARSLSCHCDHCLRREFKKLKCEELEQCGSMFDNIVHMTQTAGARVTTKLRGRKGKVSDSRRLAARNTCFGEVVALDSANDSEHTFWLARVVEPATKYAGLTKPRHDPPLHNLKNNYYLKVCMFDRFPIDSSTIFKLGKEVRIINAEAVILRHVCAGHHCSNQVQTPDPRTSRHPAGRTVLGDHCEKHDSCASRSVCQLARVDDGSKS
jgi:hypothetical protein